MQLHNVYLCLLKSHSTGVRACAQQVGLLFPPSSKELNIENAAQQDGRVSTAKIFTATSPKQVRVRV